MLGTRFLSCRWFFAIALTMLCAVSAEASFDGQSVTVHWEMWNGSSPGEGGSLIAATDTNVFVASDSASPDVVDFHDSSGTTNELWDIDFQNDTITLTYTSIEYQDSDHCKLSQSAIKECAAIYSYLSILPGTCSPPKFGSRSLL